MLTTYDATEVGDDGDVIDYHRALRGLNIDVIATLSLCARGENGGGSC